MKCEVNVAQLCPILCDPMDYTVQNTGVGSLSLFQGIFPTQGLNQGLLHCRRILYQLSYRGSPHSLSLPCILCVHVLSLILLSREISFIY